MLIRISEAQWWDAVSIPVYYVIVAVGGVGRIRNDTTVLCCILSVTFS